MKLHKIYENLITEEGIEGCIKLFGYELFGDELGGSERNTPIENRYHDEIIDFTDNMYGESITPEFMAMIKNLRKCIGQYPEVLIPDETNVYRGTMLPLRYFVDNVDPINIKNGNEYTYRGFSKIQSWTTDYSITENFGDNEHLLDFKSYIRKANTSDYRQELLQDMLDEELYLGFTLSYIANPQDFLFKSKYFNLLSVNKHEHEILRVNNRPIEVGAFLRVNKDTDLIYQLIKIINLAILGR